MHLVSNTNTNTITNTNAVLVVEAPAYRRCQNVDVIFWMTELLQRYWEYNQDIYFLWPYKKANLRNMAVFITGKLCRGKYFLTEKLCQGKYFYTRNQDAPTNSDIRTA